MKLKLFQLVMTFIAVVALSPAGITKIHYWEDFENYDEGYDISTEEGWALDGSNPVVDSSASMKRKNGSAGKNSLMAGGWAELDYPELNLPLNEESVIGCWAMPNGLYVGLQSADGFQYTLRYEDVFKYFAEHDKTGWVETQVPFEPDRWYLVMWAGSGTTLDLYVDKTSLYSCKAAPTISATYVRIFFRFDSRVDNVFITDSKTDIYSIFAVEPVGKLTTAWGRIKAE